ncbi:MAG: hypothetical protein JWL94_1507 [Microbacteriaceae bacterium]|jgi:hypothetical protein|nr:hypothetical protein [Microbacteriaceae bacterium]
MHFYADDRTRKLLLSPQPKVYLYGGFEGFDNYGDVIQLKGAIEFHQRTTGRTPIAILSLAAWTESGLLDRLAATYGIEGFVFEDANWLDASDVGLAPVEAVQAGALLHIYGGGYFNTHWGARRAFVCEQIIFGLHIGQYVVSGVQVDAIGVSHLVRLFDLKVPLIVGGRDELSVRLLSDVLPMQRVRYSFDDAVEFIEALNEKLVLHGGSDGSADRTVGFHMNLTSEYIGSDQRDVATAIVRAVVQRYDSHGATLLHAYNDRRRIVRDTLQSINEIGLSALFPMFNVVDFASLSVRSELDTGTLRTLLLAIDRIDFVITASYHIALTMNLLGKPTFLLAENEYYRDKRAALGLADDIDAFLAQPRRFLRDFADERRQRRDWIEELTRTIEATEWWSEEARVPAPMEAPAERVSSRYFGR